MASLQLQQFCCRSLAPRLVWCFHPPVWNGLCLGSAALGLAGLLLQALARHRRGCGQAPGRGSENRLRAARGIVAAITASSCLGTAGILSRSVLWLAAPPGSAGQPPVNRTVTAGFAGPLCTVAVMWVQYFYTAHFWALFCYALEAVQLLRRPAGCRCDSQRPLAQALAVAHYAAAYVPLLLVLLLNPLLLSRALCAAAALLRGQTGRYTASERLQEQQLRRRFTSITVTFTACWLGNVVTDGLLLLEPAWRTETLRLLHVAIRTSWIIVAILNPVSGLLLSLALVGWQRAGPPAGRALRRDGQSSSEDSPEPVLGLVTAPGQLRAPNLLDLLTPRASHAAETLELGAGPSVRVNRLQPVFAFAAAHSRVGLVEIQCPREAGRAWPEAPRAGQCLAVRTPPAIVMGRQERLTG
ncbi:COMM domain-containing protein 5-like [Platysternon megacephalum]|uniref:COMM domain-containing protein 5-like n=1 Tax=Platysternon megacephalum TaxID=55544 RepID=A0A4D9EV46_9SAUR|nr:COMM domain-containing protein 5-like [Platysternon megacephalum]